MAHATPADVAVALTWKTMLLPVCVPCAVPTTASVLFWHEALKLPRALFAVFSVTDHAKLVHESGDGIVLIDRYVPARVLTDNTDEPGAVIDVALRLNSKQPADTEATSAKTEIE